MPLFRKDCIDDGKVLELIATMIDFMDESTGDEGVSYGKEEARISLEKKTKTLNALNRYNINGYKGFIDKKMLQSAQMVKDNMKDLLSAWIQEDKLTIEDDIYSRRIAILTDKAKEAEIKLGMSWKVFMVMIWHYVQYYKANHNGEEPDAYYARKYSIRRLLD